MQPNEVIEQTLERISTLKFGIKVSDSKLGRDGWLNWDESVSSMKREEVEAILRDLKPKDKVKIQLCGDGGFAEIEVIEKAKEEQEDGIIGLEQLLDKAHKDSYLTDIKTEMIEHNAEKAYAIFKATVTADKVDIKGETKCTFGQKTFTAYGDASKAEFEGNKMQLGSAYIRMAETRAVVRALRWLTNVAKAAKEEISDKPAEK
jgi:hypothetical protein